MIYTSYFANWRNFPNNFLPVSIANRSPKGFKGVFYEPLLPGNRLVNDYKNSIISNLEYTIKYKEKLDRLDPIITCRDLDDCLLLCYEKSEDFCHRNIVREWLSDYIDIKEL